MINAWYLRVLSLACLAVKRGKRPSENESLFFGCCTFHECDQRSMVADQVCHAPSVATPHPKRPFQANKSHASNPQQSISLPQLPLARSALAEVSFLSLSAPCKMAKHIQYCCCCLPRRGQSGRRSRHGAGFLPQVFHAALLQPARAPFRGVGVPVPGRQGGGASPVENHTFVDVPPKAEYARATLNRCLLAWLGESAFWVGRRPFG